VTGRVNNRDSDKDTRLHSLLRDNWVWSSIRVIIGEKCKTKQQAARCSKQRNQLDEEFPEDGVIE